MVMYSGMEHGREIYGARGGRKGTEVMIKEGKEGSWIKGHFSR